MNRIEAESAIVRLCVGLCVVVLGLFLSSSTCAENTTWTFNPPALFPTNEWGPVTNDCQLGLRFPKLQYQAGEQILAAIILRNVGDNQLRMLPGDPQVTVTKADGRSVPYTESWATIINRPKIGGSARAEDLPPHHQQHPRWVDITERYILDKPGEYIVTVKDRTSMARAASQDAHATNVVTTVEILSNPVTITVVSTNLLNSGK